MLSGSCEKRNIHPRTAWPKLYETQTVFFNFSAQNTLLISMRFGMELLSFLICSDNRYKPGWSCK